MINFFVLIQNKAIFKILIIKYMKCKLKFFGNAGHNTLTLYCISV